MDDQEVLERPTAIRRLTSDPGRAVGLAPETVLAPGAAGSLGLDSLGIEDRVGPMIDDREGLAPHLQSLRSLTWARAGAARRRVG
ncbi:MAG TPA: hypothetical protein VJ144_01865 [Candidatus Polarisedimenticolia bacterium]|nr:hypothetical protein [Candidatus Polarisedimenticolia bacterium]